MTEEEQSVEPEVVEAEDSGLVEPRSAEEMGDVPPPSEAEAGQVITTECAFMVYMLPDGHWTANSKVINTPMAVGREASFVDMYNAAATIQKDITVMETAQQTVQKQQEFAAAMAQQMQQQAILRNMEANGVEGATKGGLDLSNLTGPNRQQRRHG